MKKTLLLASAAVLFATSAQAMDEGLKLGIEGYASVYGAYADQDSDVVGDNATEFNLMKELELDFTGETTLENGLTVGVTVELKEEEQGSDEEVDEAYMFVEGGFGKVIVGAEKPAAYLMQVAAPAVDAEIDGMDPTYDIVEEGNNNVYHGGYDMSLAQEYSEEIVGDKITYISPVWSGFQFGASYTPDVEVKNNQYLETEINYEAFSFAARYAYAHEDFDLTVGAGYNTNAKDYNFDQWNIAAVAEFDAWTVGAAYYEEDTDWNDDNEVLALGVNYTDGNFNYGVSYMNKTDEDSLGDDELDRYMVGVNYTYGPGMTLNGSLGYYDYKDDEDLSDAENEATVLAVGTVINF